MASSDPRVVVPTVVVGLGQTGGDIVAAIRADADARSPEANANARFVTASGVPGAELTEQVRAALAELLSAGHTMLASRVSPNVPIDLFVVAKLAEDDVPPATLRAAIAALDAAYRPFEALLSSDPPGGRIFASPILLLPNMDAREGAAGDLRDATVGLLDELSPRFVREDVGSTLPLARAWLVEPRTSHYLLDEPTRTSMVRAFLRFLLYGSLRTDPEYQRVFEPGRDRDPYGSFVVACAELPGAGGMRELVGVEGALRAMQAFEQPSGVGVQPDLAAYGEGAWIDSWLAQLPGDAVEREVETAIARRSPAVARTVGGTRLLERPERVRGRFDAAWLAATRRALAVSDDDPVVGEAVRTVVHTMAREGAQRVDEQVAALDDALESWLEGDSAAHHLDALAFLADVERVVDERLHDEEARAAATPDPGPDLEAVDGAVASLHQALDRKPDPALTLPLGALVMVLLVTLGAGLLPLVAGVFERPGEDRPLWLVALRDDPYYIVSAAVIVAVAIGGFLFYRLWSQTRAVNHMLDGQDGAADGLGQTLRQAESGQDRSVAAFYRSRFALTEAHWRARALADLRRGLGARRKRLERAQQAARAQRRALEQRRDRIVARLDDEARETPFTVPVVPLDTVRALVASGADASVGDQPIRRVKALLHPYRGASLAVPFGDIEPLVRAVRAGAPRVSLRTVLESVQHGPDALARVRVLMDDVSGMQRLGGGAAAGTRLHLPLGVRGLEDDPQGVANLDSPRVFLAAEVLELVQEATRDTRGGELLGRTKAFFDPDRVYVLQVAWGIHQESLSWLRTAEESGEPPESAVISIERGRKSEDAR